MNTEPSPRRALLDIAGLLQIPAKIILATGRRLKVLPVLDAEPEGDRYRTVLDLDLSRKANRQVYRRVNTETITGLCVSFGGAA